MSISEVKQTVRTNAKEIGRQVTDGVSKSVMTVGEKKQILDMQREIRLSRIGAKMEHRGEVRQLKKAVSQEAAMAKAAR